MTDIEKIKDRISAVIIKNKKLLLVTGYDEVLYWTPGGKIDNSESHEDSINRELDEEIGINSTKIEFYMEYETINEITNKRQIVYCYLVDFKGEPKPQKEITKIVWCSKKDLTKYNISKGISDNLIPKLIKDNLI